jgi:hypothetical protein
VTEEQRRKMIESLPDSMKDLPLDPRGFPIPWFVHCEPGQTPDLRIASGEKREIGFRDDLCWVCGQPLGKFRVFLGGPQSVKHCCFSDWCCHEKCAIFSAMFCPFVNGSMQRRREGGMESTVALPGQIPEPPPVYALLYAVGKIVRSAHGHFLTRPGRVTWFHRGRMISDTEARLYCGG